MAKTLIISEKPSAAAKIASALGKSQQKKLRNISYFEIPSKNIIVAPAVGHLFSLTHEKRMKYPIFDLIWKPTFEINRTASFAKPYYQNLVDLSKKATNFIVATDYDVEGEVIGYNIIRFICNKKDAKRMKFSTLTKPDLEKSYKEVMKTLDWSQAEAGLTRHYLDWFFGINLSRAASNAIALATNRYRTLSIGRVQGPALKLLTERELEIKKFKPVPYWQIFINVEYNSKKKYQAVHEKDKFMNNVQAEKIYKKIKDKPALLAAIKKSAHKVNPPHPFDLTSLQIESHRLFRMSPKQTLSAAQSLYEKSYISYPRTSSQQLPPSINYKKILTSLSKVKNYAEKATIVLHKKSLKPNNGKKTDPAHPAIYPTGEKATFRNDREKKLYDLIVKRFFATFGETGERETKTLTFDVEKEKFILKGTRTTKQGWQYLYEPYVKKEEVELPGFKKDEVYKQKSQKDKKETQPPKRYNEASIIKALEKENLGTKSTRAGIIDILFQRGYVKGRPIQVTDLGLEMVQIFDKYAPKIMSKALTREFEQDMEKVRSGKIKRETILERAKKTIKDILKDFEKHNLDIGKELSKAVTETTKQITYVMKCPECKKGDLRIMMSYKTRKHFVGCSNYPKCTHSYPLPPGLIEFTDKICEKCKTPFYKVIRQGKRPYTMCLDPKCPTKKDWAKAKKSKQKKS